MGSDSVRLAARLKMHKIAKTLELNPEFWVFLTQNFRSTQISGLIPQTHFEARYFFRSTHPMLLNLNFSYQVLFLGKFLCLTL